MTRVLIVEDNEDNQEIYCAYLTHLGYSVTCVRDAENGLAAARLEQPAVILMDIGLPGMDGMEATRILKADLATSHIPIVALTAHAEPVVQQLCAEVGCDGYIIKPALPAEICRVVERFAGLPTTES